ncbi:MAG: hypothetical protein LBE74_09175 [Treponema sp.]|jgi:hypothetical protein|nr:hypothetical protein [Treponema sp.]
METKKRRLIIRAAIVITWIGLGGVLFVTNRGHSLLVDNRNVAALNLRAPDLVIVTVDKSKPTEFLRGDRNIFKVGGGKHRVTVEFADGTPPFTKTFTLPLKGDMFLLSIPKLTNGIESFYEEFVNTATRNADEAPTNEP